MEKAQTQKARQRTFEDRWVSGFNSLRFAVLESIGVRINRARYDRLYADPSDKPLVSVCVPTYNRGELLIERAVSSVLAQTYTNLELIVVGDHCTDNTPELLAKITDPRLRFYNLPSRKRKYPPTVENHWLVGGAVPANKAMEMARGKWIARVDDDDTWSPDHIETLLHFAQKERYEFVSALYVEERFGVKKTVDGVKARDPYYTRRDLKPGDDSPKIGGVSTWLYRSYLRFMKYNPDCWRKSWNRVWDVDLSLRIFGAGVRMGFLDQVLAYVLPRPGETSVGLEAYKLTEQQKLEHYKLSNE
jgi:glycosyltransferase involved in cell wall biosynthesis